MARQDINKGNYPNDPNADSIYQAISKLQQMLKDDIYPGIGVANAGIKPFETKADMDGFTPGSGDPEVALVGNDGSNNGFYFWDSSNTTWDPADITTSVLDPSDEVRFINGKAVADFIPVSRYSLGWVSRKSDFSASDNKQAIDSGAVLSAQIIDPLNGYDYFLAIICKNDDSFNDRLYIKKEDSNGNITTSYTSDSPPISDYNGINQMELNGDNGEVFLLTIDYSQIPDGIFLNGGHIYIDESAHVFTADIADGNNKLARASKVFNWAESKEIYNQVKNVRSFKEETFQDSLNTSEWTWGTVQNNDKSSLSFGDEIRVGTRDGNDTSNYLWIARDDNSPIGDLYSDRDFYIQITYKLRNASEGNIRFYRRVRDASNNYASSTVAPKNGDLQADGKEHTEVFHFEGYGSIDAAKQILDDWYVYISTANSDISAEFEISRMQIWLGRSKNAPQLIGTDNLEENVASNIQVAQDLKDDIGTSFKNNIELFHSESEYIFEGISVSREWAADGLIGNDQSKVTYGEKVRHFYRNAADTTNYHWLYQWDADDFQKLNANKNKQIIAGLNYLIENAPSGGFEVAFRLNYVDTNGDSQSHQFRFTLKADGEEHYDKLILGTINGIDPDLDFIDGGYVFIENHNADTNTDFYLSSFVLTFGDGLLVPKKVKSNDLSQNLYDSIFTSASKIPKDQLRVSLVGDSVTWGDGRLDDVHTGIVGEYLRKAMATTLLPPNVSIVGTTTDISNDLLYKGSAKKLTGAGNYVEFTLNGDELTICQSQERSNSGAAILELYVDGQLYDTFSNYNEQPSGSETKTFTGDGSAVKFDLGRPFTYNHTVTVDGVTQSGGMNTYGYGASIPSGDDYLIIRKYSTDANGEIIVNHFIWFDSAPANGANIEVSFDYGENIKYGRSTYGEVGEALNNSLESSYGDGDTSYDPANPASMSSGLDFRHTDERAIKRWRFYEEKERTFKIKIKELDPRASGTPYFIFDFATNRYHWYQNAGIGGWTTAEFNSEQDDLNNANNVTKHRPDKIFTFFGTNDDWRNGNDFVASRLITGLTEAEVRDIPVLWYKSVTYNSVDDYDVESAELNITSMSPNQVTVDTTNVTFESPSVGDLIIIGDYYGDNRKLESRVISSIDTTAGTVGFDRPLKNPQRFVGQVARLKTVDSYLTETTEMVNDFKNKVPSADIYLADTGLSNYKTRLLIGYPEAIRQKARELGVGYVNLYKLLEEFQYSQEQTVTAYLNSGGNQTADGSSEYNLVDSGGTDINEANSTQLRNFSVKVNGIEVLGKDCHIEGGYARTFKDSVAADQLQFSGWNNRGSGTDYSYIPAKLVFTQNVPSNVDTIEVSATSKSLKWAADDAHVNENGAFVFAQGILSKVM